MDQTALRQEILEILTEDARIAPEQMAAMLRVDAAAIAAAIDEMRQEGIIVQYKTVINWEKTPTEKVSALIEVKVNLQRDQGFDAIAERIYHYDEVRSVYLMSGGYDLMVLVEGNTMKEVALFVAEKLSVLDNVLSTGTHFLLKRYKEDGVIMAPPRDDERLVIS